MEEAHYRLAQVYRLTGDKAKAAEEIQRYEQMSQASAGGVDRERHEIKQFVYTLRDQKSAPQPPK